MNTLPDNSNISKQERNIVILATFQNIRFYDFQDGSLYYGFLIIFKSSISFSFRWTPYKPAKKLFSFETEKPIQLINSIQLSRVVIETNHHHCEASLYTVGNNEPIIFRTTEDPINFSHQLAQIFTINSVFITNPNWIYLTEMFINPPTEESGSITYFLPCYKGKFSYPVFLSNHYLQKISENSNKSKEIESNDQKKLEEQQSSSLIISNNDPNSTIEQIKSFFNFSKFSNLSQSMSKPPTTANQTEKNESNSFLSNFTQIFSKYKIKSTNLTLPLTKSEFMLLISQKVQFSEVKKMIAFQGMDVELRRELWPIFLSILPIENNEKILSSRVNEYKSLKLQWSSLSQYQLAQSRELRSAFHTIGMDVKRTTVPSELFSYLSNNDDFCEKKATSFFKHVLQNVLKTFAVWNNNIRYTQGINELVVPFICVALYDIINEVITLKIDLNDSSEVNTSKINLNDLGDVNTSNNSSNSNISMLIEKVEEREALAFWCFVAFQEKSQNVLLETSMNNLIECDIPEILEIVKKQSRDTFKFIKQHQLDSLNFLVSPFMLLFRRSFCEMKVERLWDTIIVLDEANGAKNSSTLDLIRRKNFEYAFAASVLIFAVQLLRKKVTAISEDKNNFESNLEMLILKIPDVIESLPIEYVIRVALAIENDLPMKIPPRIVNYEKDIFENELFSPNFVEETNMYSSFGLFC